MLADQLGKRASPRSHRDGVDQGEPAVGRTVQQVGAWPVLGKVMRLHVAAYRATNGKIGHPAPGLPTMLLLQHVGAKSGTLRTTPLLYTRDGDNLVLVASKGGYSRHPAWYHNLRAHSDTTVQVREEVLPVHARVAGPGERRRLWPQVVEAYSPYDSYQQRTDREIPW